MSEPLEPSNTNPIWRRLVSSTLIATVLAYTLALSGCSAVGANLGHLVDLDAAKTARIKKYDVTLSSGTRLENVSLSLSLDPQKTVLHRTPRLADDTIVGSSDIVSRELHVEPTGMRTGMVIGMAIDLAVLFGLLFFKITVDAAKAAGPR